MTVHPISDLLRHIPSHSNRFSKLLKHIDRSFPADTRISDADTLLQAGWTLRWNLLAAFIDVRFDHDANDTCLAFS